MQTYGENQRFAQAKLGYIGFDLGSSQFLLQPQTLLASNVVKSDTKLIIPLYLV